MHRRDKINLIIDLLLTLSVALIAGIGILITYALPPGREKILKFGDNRELVFLGLDRHQWGTIHLAAGIIMLGLLALHILLHWKTMLCLVRKAVPSVGPRRTLWSAIGTLCFLLLSFALFVSPKRLETEDFLHRNIHSELKAPTDVPGRLNRQAQIDKRAHPSPASHGMRQEHAAGRSGKTSREMTARGLGSAGRHLGESDRDPLNGRITLEQAADRFRITLSEARLRLGIPAHVPGSDTIGRLRRIHGFSMQEARERLEKERGEIDESHK